MAKPKSEDKRNAILSAAIQVFAERGLGAPTAAITSAAGIAEGSLFTYFTTKEELINALYRELKLGWADRGVEAGGIHTFHRNSEDGGGCGDTTDLQGCTAGFHLGDAGRARGDDDGFYGAGAGKGGDVPDRRV